MVCFCKDTSFSEKASEFVEKNVFLQSYEFTFNHRPGPFPLPQRPSCGLVRQGHGAPHRHVDLVPVLSPINILGNEAVRQTRMVGFLGSRCCGALL